MKSTNAQKIVSLLLGLFLIVAGFGHLTFLRIAFQAQVPNWVAIDADLVVVISGIVEIFLGSALLFLQNHKVSIGWIIALFLVAVFPGNIAQLVNHKHAFGLNSDLLLWIRLPFQPILIATVLWSTTAWSTWRNKPNKSKIH